MNVYEKWKKDMESKIKRFTKDEEIKEKIPAIIKRCPKCNNLTLQFDPKTGRIYCTSCGFEEYIKTVK